MFAEAVYLGSYLAPVAGFLARDGVTDIYINRPGELWLETLVGAIERHDVPDLTRSALLRLARQVAAFSSQGINREHPLLAASLPDGSRIQIAMPPATRGEVAIAIRRHVSAGLSLDAYTEQEGQSASVPNSGSDRADRSSLADGDKIAMLRQAVVERRTILVSGGTSSGKTTFLNALLREIPEQERLITIEDTPELQISHANAVGLIAVRGMMGEADVTAEDLLIAALRMRPDRIILGEIRGSEAMTFLRAINTGHPGSLSTIHADSPERAIDQLALLTLQGGIGLSWEEVRKYIKKSIDVVVQLSRRGRERFISEINEIRY